MRHLFAANWKMCKTVSETVNYFSEFKALIQDLNRADIYIAPSYTAIYSLSEIAKNTPIRIGAQNMSDAAEGPYTGEISAKMLLETGASFVILGHSERRRLYHEDNKQIQKKIFLALQYNLDVILCVGETSEERFSGNTNKVIEKQLEECLEDLDETKLKKLTIAYEPVWAIGNGHAATPVDAERVHQFIRNWLEYKWRGKAYGIRILYGGSVNEKNASDFLNEKDINGLLVGTASLNPKTFSEIVNLG